MTGISLPGSRAIRPNKVELPSERYTRLLKGVPERYSILQVGVALFHKNPQWKKEADGDGEEGRDRANSTSSHRSRSSRNDEGEEGEHAYMHREGMLNQDELEDLTEREEDAADAAAEAGVEEDNANGDDPSSPEKSAPVEEEEEQSEYISRVYNFYLFPSGSSKREMTLNPSTVKFLLDNHMDFDKVFREGIPYTTAGQAEYLKNRYFEKYNETNKGGDGSSSSSKPRNTPRRKVKLTRVEDIAFVARTMAGLREWIDSGNSAMQNLADAAVAVAAAEANTDGDAAGTNGDENSGANGGNSNGNSAGGREGTSLVLPPCNAFLRRCLYETIEDEYPGLILEKADMDPTHAGAARNQIRVIRMSDAEKKRREDRLRHESWHKLLNDIGFTTLFQAISDACCGKSFSKEQTASFLDGTSPALTIAKESTEENVAERKVPLIIHNGLQDLMFLMTHCHDPALPDDFEDTKKAIRSYFPSIFDTKVFATEYSDAIIRGGSTTLGVLFSGTCNNDGAGDDFIPKIPTIVNKNGQSQGEAHEAGWDAYMTGCVFNALCKRILESKNRLDMDLTLDSLLHDSADNLLREWLGLNMIYNHVSLFTIDLESSLGPVAGVHDPLSSGLSVDTTFHVSGITTSVSTRDILKALTNYEGEEEDIHLLKYEIIWVDDASFFVGTRMTEDIAPVDSATTDLVASHVRNKLRSGLGNDVEISPLGDYFEKKYGAAAKTVEESTGVVGSLVSVATMPFRVLGSVLGLGKRSSSEGADGVEQPKKRRKFG